MRRARKHGGEIKPGLRADLVLVDGDPTTDIKATRAIARVFKNGYQVDRTITQDKNLKAKVHQGLMLRTSR